jgi:hypothetical protein
MKLTLARKRLLLGSSNVGVMVVVSSILLLTGSLKLLFSNQSFSTFHDFFSLVIFFFTFAVLQSGFDLMGATACERDEVYPDLKVIFTALLRGIIFQTAIVFSSALLIHFCAIALGGFGALFMMCSIFYFLSKLKIRIAKMISPELLLEQVEDQQTIVSSNQPSFHGGIFKNEDLFSKNILSALTSEESQILHARRKLILQSGAARLAEKYAFGILLIGASVGIFIFGIRPQTVSGLCEFALWNSIWSFICLLIIPTFDRQSVFDADRALLQQGIDKAIFESAIRKQDAFFDDEKVRTKMIEKIFHPIPMLEDRIAEIRNFDLSQIKKKRFFNSIPFAPWHILRQSLYLSWGSLNLISRSVHCSVGRPQCWVFLPVE